MPVCPPRTQRRVLAPACEVAVPARRAQRQGRAPLLIAVALAAVAMPDANASDDSLARHVPADIGLFVELRRGEDLLLPLAKPDLWLALAELTGQPADRQESSEWRQRVEQTIGMSPEEAVHTLLAQRVAFAAESWRGSQDAVILCRPPESPRELLKRWAAQPLPTAARATVYRLPNSVGVALLDDVLIFGDQASPTIFPQVLRSSPEGGTARLADDPIYRRLLERVPAEPDGVLFVRLKRTSAAAPAAPAATEPTTRPANLPLPRPLADSDNVLLALHRKGKLLHLTAVGDAPARERPSPDEAADLLVDRLPARTLLAWSLRVDYAELGSSVDALPERHLLRIVKKVHERSGAIERLTRALDTRVAVALGVVDAPPGDAPAPPTPAVALLVSLRDPRVAEDEWRTLFHATIGVYKLLSLRRPGPREDLSLSTLVLGDRVAEQVDFSPVLRAALGPGPLDALHMSWVVDDDVLILASHSDWLRQIVSARRQSAGRLADSLEAVRPTETAGRESVLIAQPGPMGDLADAWLEFLASHFPMALDEEWWRRYQPDGGRVRLGLQVIPDPEQSRLSVQGVVPGSPAAGVIQPGDVILGVSRRRFATTQPVEEIQRAVENRPNARWVDLLVERDHAVRVRRVPVPFVDPVQLLQRFSAIGEFVQRVTYAEGASAQGEPLGQLTIELRDSDEPLFVFAPRAVTAEPASEAAAPAPPATTQPDTQ